MTDERRKKLASLSFGEKLELLEKLRQRSLMLGVARGQLLEQRRRDHRSDALQPQSVEEARVLLLSLGAPTRLIRHTELVGEAAELLLAHFNMLGLHVDRDFVRVGVVLHDAGKVVCVSELSEQGHAHESEGERILLRAGVSPVLARVCLSHAQWATLECSIEELIVALADKLWKGVRVKELESRLIALVATQLNKDIWDIFIETDNCFERIAAAGESRLQRSRH